MVLVQFPTKRAVTFALILNNCIMIAQYLLLHAVSGAVIAINSTLRCFILYLYARKGKEPPVKVLVILTGLAVATCLLFWQDKWTLLTLAATLMYNYALWQENMRRYRILCIVHCLCWFTYDLIFMAYAAAAMEAGQAVSAAVALCRYASKEKTGHPGEKTAGKSPAA